MVHKITVNNLLVKIDNRKLGVSITTCVKIALCYTEKDQNQAMHSCFQKVFTEVVTLLISFSILLDLQKSLLKLVCYLK